MNHSAYLVIFVDGDTLEFKGAGIYSEPGHSLTRDGSNQVVAATVFECWGDSYEEARTSVLENCKTWRHMQWLLEHVR